MMLVAIAMAMLATPPQVTPPSALEQAPQAQAQARAYVFARPNPGIHLSPSGGARYAMEQGCIPHVMTGRPAHEFFQTARFARAAGEGRYAVTSAVTLKEDASGSCVIIVRRGDPEGLREEILKVFDENGARRTMRADSGEGARDSNGFRHELYCIVLDGHPLFLMMSSSSASDRPKLYASLGNDAEGECARR